MMTQAHDTGFHASHLYPSQYTDLDLDLDLIMNISIYSQTVIYEHASQTIPHIRQGIRSLTSGEASLTVRIGTKGN